jgi:hypothetical protein
MQYKSSSGEKSCLYIMSTRFRQPYLQPCDAGSDSDVSDLNLHEASDSMDAFGASCIDRVKDQEKTNRRFANVCVCT